MSKQRSRCFRKVVVPASEIRLVDRPRHPPVWITVSGTYPDDDLRCLTIHTTDSGTRPPGLQNQIPFGRRSYVPFQSMNVVRGKGNTLLGVRLPQKESRHDTTERSLHRTHFTLIRMRDFAQERKRQEVNSRHYRMDFRSLESFHKN